MLIEVVRDQFTANSTGSQVLIDGKFFCFGMEPRQDQSHGKPYCIPLGEYDLILQHSDKFQQSTPHVLGVPGFKDIEIHPGNFPRNTEGCLLVGRTRADDYVGESVTAFEAMRDKIWTLCKIVYRNRDSNG